MKIAPLCAILLALAVTGCGPSIPNVSPAPGRARLVHPEDLILPPPGARWPQPAGGGLMEGPHYPTAARDAGIEDRIVAAFVMDTQGHVEYPTISIVKRASEPGFTESVCAFLRRAEFNWAPHVAARGLVITAFEFTLDGGSMRHPLPPRVNLDSLRDVPRHFTPEQLAAWIESMPHCP